MGQIAYYKFLLLLSGVVAFAAYLTSLAPTITWAHGSADSGELVTAAYYLGIAHPTGYPAYVLLGWLFSHLPFGSIALRVNLLSAISASLAVAFVVMLMAQTQTQRAPLARALGAGAGALLLAFSPMFWSQAVVTEVYALNALLIVLICLGQERWLRDPPRARAAGLLGLALGAGVANHVTILLLVPGIVLRLWSRVRPVRQVGLRPLALFVAGLLFGVSLYLLLPICVMSASPFVNWGDVRTIPAFFEHVTGLAYRGALFSLPPELVVTKLPALARLLLEQYGWIGYGLAVLGIWSMARANTGFLLSWASSSFFYAFFAVNYPVLDSQVYLLPFFLLVALAIGAGAAMLIDETARRFTTQSLPTVAVSLLLLLLVVSSFVATRPKVNERDDWEAYGYAEATLDALPQRAILVTREDRHIFSLWYLQYVEAHRQDVALVDTRLLSWPWYRRNLAKTYPDLVVPDLSTVPLKELLTFAAANVATRPVYLAFEGSSLPTMPEGELLRVVPEGLPAASP